MRLDAMRDLGITWRWAGFGVRPEPEARPEAVTLDGHAVGLAWSERGWGVSRLAFVCPVCARRARFLYPLRAGGFGCSRHVSPKTVTRESAFSDIGRARTLQRNHRWRRRGENLESLALARLLLL